MLAVVNPIIELNLSSHFKANMEVSYYYRHTHYSYHEDIKYKTFETRLGLLLSLIHILDVYKRQDKG